MLRLSILFLLFVSLCNLKIHAQLKGGPIQGFSTENSVSFWFMIGVADTIELSMYNKATKKAEQKQTLLPDSLNCHKSDCSVKITFNRLKPNTNYQLETTLNGEYIDTHKFSTKQKNTNSQQDFSILTGSCAFIPSGLLNLLFPFHNLKIYKQMSSKQAKFMLWLGDTVYYIKDKNKQRKVRRNILYRKKKRLNEFLKSKPQIAMWDDHDFGYNNADGTYIDKAASLETFNNFWVNPKSEMSDGSYFKISQDDVDFFVLDNRSYSKPPKTFNTTILGDKQKSWLKRSLKKSKATFKIICSGNQFIADYLSDKTFALYPEERKEIFTFLEKNKIEGVFFLTGDRHHTEMMQKQVDGLYTMYEYSSSPITSWPNKRFNSKRFNKDQRIEGSLINKRNFGKLSFIGGNGNRKCVIETFNKKGKLLYTRIINENELKFKE